ncbi:MAG: hypothetical protein Q9220_002665 [cf. Caloplaca sp. 1 TL-2023]
MRYLPSLPPLASLLVVALLTFSRVTCVTITGSLQPSLPPLSLPQTTTYDVPSTGIRIELTARNYPLHTYSRPMPPASIANLIETGITALDILAQRAGGDRALLDVPRIRWAISGLVIMMNDATVLRPATEVVGGRMRFDEMRAAYWGIGRAIGTIGDVESSVRVFRRGSVRRRRDDVFLGWGFIQVGEMMEEAEDRNGTVLGMK